MLSNFHLLDLLAHGSTIASTVLANNADLLSMLGLKQRKGWMYERVGGVRVTIETGEEGVGYDTLVSPYIIR